MHAVAAEQTALDVERFLATQVAHRAVQQHAQVLAVALCQHLVERHLAVDAGQVQQLPGAGTERGAPPGDVDLEDPVARRADHQLQPLRRGGEVLGQARGRRRATPNGEQHRHLAAQRP